MKRFLVALAAALIACASLTFPRSARAEGENASLAFGEATQALERGAYSEAIDRFEALSDTGFTHPDASYNRGLAYVGRARSPQTKPGDLGRAAAAFSEALLQRPDDHDAERDLGLVRSELSHKLARGGRAPLSAEVSLGRAVTGLFSENSWAMLACVGAIGAAAGLALRLFGRKDSQKLSGAVTFALSLLLGFAGGTFAYSARHYRLTSSMAVVVTEQARLLDETGRPVPQGHGESDSIPEGASVYVLKQHGALSQVEWGNVTAWVVSGQVQPLVVRSFAN